MLQAIITGLRHQSDGSAVASPMPRPSAHIHELMNSGVAPKDCAAWNTIATELVKPTSTATKPAVRADRLRSLKKRIRAIVPVMAAWQGHRVDHRTSGAQPAERC